MKINLNEKVSVKLTDFGAEHYNKFNSQFGKYAPPRLNEGDVLTDELWEIMQIFGSVLHNGMVRIPFMNNQIEVLDDNISSKLV